MKSKHIDSAIPRKSNIINNSLRFYNGIPLPSVVEINESGKCNTVRVGFVDSGLHKKILNNDFDKRVSLMPIKRTAEPKEIIEIVFYLGSTMNTYTTYEVISIAGGE